MDEDVHTYIYEYRHCHFPTSHSQQSNLSYIFQPHINTEHYSLSSHPPQTQQQQLLDHLHSDTPLPAVRVDPATPVRQLHEQALLAVQVQHEAGRSQHGLSSLQQGSGVWRAVPGVVLDRQATSLI